jgi:hypothetical protein
MTGVAKDSITKDMVMQILLKLPVKSMLRFRCASKSWNSLVTSPGFMKNHLDKAKQLLLLRTENPVVSYSLHLDNDRVDMRSRLEFPIPNEAGLFLIYVSVRASLRAPRLIPRPTEHPANPVGM